MSDHAFREKKALDEKRILLLERSALVISLLGYDLVLDWDQF